MAVALITAVLNLFAAVLRPLEAPFGVAAGGTRQGGGDGLRSLPPPPFA